MLKDTPRSIAINLFADFAVEYGDAGNRGTPVQKEMWKIIVNLKKELNKKENSYDYQRRRRTERSN